MKIHVFRYDPKVDNKPYYETYEISKKEKMTVLDALNTINAKYGANIAFRSSCKAGQCGSCAVKVNGKPVLACKHEVENNAIIEPLDLPVIKDLIVDRKEMENKAREMHLYLHSKKTKDLRIIKPEKYWDSRKVRGCIECFSCLTACPVIKETSKYLGPYHMNYIAKFAFDPRDEYNRVSQGIKKGIYYCTTCGACEEVCPKGLNLPGDAIEKLRELAYKEEMGPLPPHTSIRKRVEKTGRSVDSIGKSFIDNVSKFGESNIAFFTGCLVDYRMPEVGEALLKIFENIGLDIDVPKGQVCCGSPLIRTGQTDIVKELVEKNREIFEGYDTVITLCAGCGSTLKNDYPKFGVKLNVKDISEFLVDKNLNLKPIKMRVTYHDPCHLARGQNVRKEPRKILNKIPGLDFVEMDEPDRCCGAGGGVRSGKPELAQKLAKKKIEMAEKINADAIITICPFCQLNMQDAANKKSTKIKVLNIVELLRKGL